LLNKRILGLILLGAVFLGGCYQPGPGAKPWQASGLDGGGEILWVPQATTADMADEIELAPPETTPTPNPPIVLPTQRSETITYTIQKGDTLRKIAQQHQVSIAQIATLNDLINADLIDVGQILLIPPPSFEEKASSFKIIPDSELINSPSTADFDLDTFVNEKNGYLAAYSEIVDGIYLSGMEIVKRVALEYSINPRLLLAVLEYQSQWVTASNPSPETLIYPMRYYEAYREGLYRQLCWASNLLNEGYYLWKINAITAWILSDGSVIQVDPTINPGTAGVLNLMRYLASGSDWERAISDEGIYETYFLFFGYPFFRALEPIIPEDLSQPDLALPFEPGAVWSYTGGPHGGWDTGSAWAAIDFAPPGESLGCFPSAAWVTASAAGEIVYSDHGTVIQDPDGDGIWQTGWSILYMHVDSWERVEVGEYLEVGDRIGHPSCEGGFSTGTHLHIARRYNGEWIAADGDLPLVLDGWVSEGYGVEYDGYLIKGDVTLEAWNGRSSFNAIQR